jgi:hypothetical protein
LVGAYWGIFVGDFTGAAEAAAEAELLLCGGVSDWHDFALSAVTDLSG